MPLCHLKLHLLGRCCDRPGTALLLLLLLHGLCCCSLLLVLLLLLADRDGPSPALCSCLHLHLLHLLCLLQPLQELLRWLLQHCCSPRRWSWLHLLLLWQRLLLLAEGCLLLLLHLLLLVERCLLPFCEVLAEVHACLVHIIPMTAVHHHSLLCASRACSCLRLQVGLPLPTAASRSTTQWAGLPLLLVCWPCLLRSCCSLLALMALLHLICPGCLHCCSG